MAIHYYLEYKEEKEAKEQVVTSLKKTAIENKEKETKITQYDLDAIAEVNSLNSDIMIMQEKRKIYNEMTDKQVELARKMKKTGTDKLIEKWFANDYMLNPEKYRKAVCKYNEAGKQECETVNIPTEEEKTEEVYTWSEDALEYDPAE